MKRIMLLVLVMCLLFASPVQAKSKTKRKKASKYIVAGYEERWIKINVKVRTKRYLGRFFITHYCPCAKCCGPGGGKVTASGTTPVAGRTVGVNPALIPYGTELMIGDTAGYVAEDTGGGAGWYHLDIFCNSHSEALHSGVGYRDVWAVRWELKKKKIKIKVPIYIER